MQLQEYGKSVQRVYGKSSDIVFPSAFRTLSSFLPDLMKSSMLPVPFEILEVIIGYIDFVDLYSFLSVSDDINVLFSYLFPKRLNAHM
jgi:hypothetical protein